MPSPVDRIKKSIPLAPFVARYTAGLKPSGRDFFLGRCPFHRSGNQRTFWVSSRLGLCGCFVPRCPAFSNKAQDPSSKPLDIINFWALLRQISNREAIEELERMTPG